MAALQIKHLMEHTGKQRSCFDQVLYVLPIPPHLFNLNSYYSPFVHFAAAAVTSLPFLQLTKAMPTSGPLHCLFLCLEHSCQTLAWLAP